jgi:hypothetical protein
MGEAMPILYQSTSSRSSPKNKVISSNVLLFRYDYSANNIANRLAERFLTGFI